MVLHEKIRKDILDRINNRELLVGDMLPTELTLCEKYNVSRSTIRNALSSLVYDGYLIRVKGQGTFVTTPKIKQESTSFIESYNYEMSRKGLKPKTKVLECSICEGPEFACKALGLEPDTLLFKLRRLRYVTTDRKKQPVVLTTVYLPYSLTGDITCLNYASESLYSVLLAQGLKIYKARRVLEIRMLHGKTARMLEAEENSPAHFIESIGYDSDGRAVEFSQSFYPADRNSFIIQVTNQEFETNLEG